MTPAPASISVRLRAFTKGMRPHQWSKNVLLFVPLLASHQYLSFRTVSEVLLGFLWFSLCASGVYFLNDLTDLEADRMHPVKRLRPLASGDLPEKVGIAAGLLLPAAAFIGALLFLPPLFTLILGFYFVTTLAYSLYFKRVSTADVFVLAALYTVRIFAGAAAVNVSVSSWLAALSMFLFLSLAYLKRYIELDGLEPDQVAHGRGYGRQDLESMFSLGVANATAAVMVLALYISSDETAVLYRTPEFLWLVCVLLLYWSNRIWIGARRGKIHDDPVLFALKDPGSRAVGLALVLVILAARHLTL